MLMLGCALLAGGCRSSCPAVMAGAGGTHPADAVAFGGHWYKVFDETMSWHEAKKRCEAMGGGLVCIETPAEQTYIAKLAAGRYLCLGATDEVKEGEWVWINGAPFTYMCWMEGQPNNYGGSENFLATYDGGDWVDVDDEGSGFWMPTGFICEWEQ
jgi:hypothetical protein